MALRRGRWPWRMCQIPRPVHVFIRGNPNNPGALTPPHFLSCLGGSEDKVFRDGSGRLDLARAIIDPAESAYGAGDREPRLDASLRRRVWFARRAISASAAIRRRIRSCSIIWP